MESKSNDLIELMKCKNCLNYLENKCKLDNQESKIDFTCSFWTENLGKKNELKEIYDTIVEILKEFIDMKEENYKIIALWIIGTWMHQSNFLTYSYLYIMAMKGSGKSRLLKLIKELSWNGDMLASLSEAVMFRTTGTLCIDEFENINHKDKNALRELLNTAYKKGGKVKRMRKKKDLDGEHQEVEEFSTFRPLVIANISGMEEVLGDRCISIILEKSENSVVTRMIEDFENHQKIQIIKGKLANFDFSVVSVVYMLTKNIYTDWNEYIKIYTLNNTPTLTTPNNILHPKEIFFNKIMKTEINGRNLELFFPLLIISEMIGLTDEIIEIVKNKVEEKKEEDYMEGRDVMLYDLISKQNHGEWYKVKQLTYIFRQQIDYDVTEEHWCNEKWMGRALKRLNLIGKKRRLGEGMEVMLNINKSIEKLRLFKK